MLKKKLVICCCLSVLTLAQSALADEILNGAGASFPYPIYSQWAYKYHKMTGTKVNYQSIGSGGGIAQIKAKTVDFGASDAPMKAKELDRCGLIQFPMVIGGVVPVFNIKGIGPGKLKLSSDVLAKIFLGQIKKWNNDAIRKINPGVNLPDQAITVVHRADGSGTTWMFTNYLCKISPVWKKKIGTGKVVPWPVGLGGKGNEGVSNYVKRVSGAIGYVEYAYALQNKMGYTLLENRSGKFVEPEIETFQAAAANADWQHAQGYYLVLTDQLGEKSWPITGASFILIYKKQKNAERAKEMLKFFDWCYRHGAKMATKLHYVPIPAKVVELVQKTWNKEVKAGGKPLWP